MSNLIFGVDYTLHKIDIYCNDCLKITKHKNGTKIYYEGSKNNEFIIRKEFDNIHNCINKGCIKEYYKGSKGNEHLIKAEYLNGQKQFYLEIKIMNI